MAMLLDLRTLPCNNVEKEVRKQAVELSHKAYVEFGYNCVSYDRKTSTTKAIVVAADAAAATAKKREAKGAAETTHAKSSQAKVNVANESISEVAQTSFDPLGIWSDNEYIEEEEEAEIYVSEEKVKELLSQKFLVKLRAWRNKQATLDWSKIDDKVTLRNPSVLDMHELMGIDISP